MPSPAVRRLHAPDETQLGQLADVLIDCVEGGASVHFLPPLSRERALAFWHDVARDVAAGARALLVVEDDRGICGTVQIVLALPENQPHRADVTKTLVHRRARNRGVGEALMRAVDETARACGKTLLVLDTDNPVAERLYARAGWIRAGAIPDFSLHADGQLVATVIYYRRLVPSDDVQIEVALEGFSDWSSVHALLLDAYAYMEGRIDPPSSLLRMGVDDFAAKAREEIPILAFESGALVGCAFVDVRDEYVYVGKLAVAAHMRRRGVARRIFDAVDALAREHGKPCIELETRIELRENHETFAALGFRQTAERAHAGYERPTFVAMRRTVAATAE